MPEIGDTLREARMRRRVDLGEVEAAIKIRAKYLRALENEEWELLPGPTFVKTFLRTYAQYLDLDPRLLVEEYRQRYERPSSHDLMPLGPGLGGRRQPRRRRSPWLAGPVVVVGLLFVALLAMLYALGRWGSDQGGSGAQQPAATPTAAASSSPARKKRARHAPARPTRVSVRLTATRDVYVCLVDARGRAVVNRRTLAAGSSTRTFRSRGFRANFGNGGIRMRVNGRTYRAAASSDPLGYLLRPGRAPRRLSNAARRRLCA